MANLGDYLGHLLSEVTIARMQADLEAIRIADIYSTDPLLKHFPVPRFRMPELTMEVPVIIEKMEEAEYPSNPRSGTYKRPSHDHFAKILVPLLDKYELKISEKETDKLKENLNKTTNHLWQFPQFPERINTLSKILCKSVTKELRNMVFKNDKEKIDKFDQSFKDLLLREVALLMPSPPRLHVRVVSSEIRELKANDALARFKISITEEACQWTVVEENNKPSDRLILE